MRTRNLNHWTARELHRFFLKETNLDNASGFFSSWRYTPESVALPEPQTFDLARPHFLPEDGEK